MSWVQAYTEPETKIHVWLTNDSKSSKYIARLWSWLARSGSPHIGQLKFFTLCSFMTTLKFALKQSLQSMSVHPGMFTIWGTRASAASWGLFWYGMEQTHSYVNLVSSLKVDTGKNSWKAPWGMAPPSWSTLSLVLKLSHVQNLNVWGEHVFFINVIGKQIFRTKRQCFACCLTNYTFSM